ncbi:MAG: 4-hydroxy-tetrahydrodipicolinate reductase, partial [Acidimicrobiales bacterium]
MIRVGVVGGAGRMGREVCRAVQEAEDLALVAVVDPATGAAETAGAAGAGSSGRAPVVSSRPEVLVDAGVEVVVDFTVAAAARQNLPRLASQGIHAVVGTTGLGPEDLEQLRRIFTGDPANAVVAPNFAIGAVLLMRFSELAAPFM